MFKDMGRITMIKAGRLREVVRVRSTAAEVCCEGKMDGQGPVPIAASHGPVPASCIPEDMLWRDSDTLKKRSMRFAQQEGMAGFCEPGEDMSC